jgi:hypothetical protein
VVLAAIISSRSAKIKGEFRMMEPATVENRQSCGKCWKKKMRTGFLQMPLCRPPKPALGKL